MHESKRGAAAFLFFVFGVAVLWSARRLFLADSYERFLVSGASMEPNFRPGDFLLLVPRGRPLRKGDVIVHRHPEQPRLEILKRIQEIRPDGRLVMVGDNAVASDDSRKFGPISSDAITGRVCARYWPPDRLQLYV